MNFPVVCAIFFFAHCLYIINGGPAYFNLETLEVSHRSDLFVPGEDYTGKHEFFLSLLAEMIFCAQVKHIFIHTMTKLSLKLIKFLTSSKTIPENSISLI